MAANEQARSDLLQQLRSVFIQRGYDGATLAHLAQASGLSKATLYHHFPGGKRDIAEQLVRLSIRQLQAECFAHLNSNDEASARLQQVVTGFIQYTEQGNSDCLLAIFIHHQANDDSLTQLQSDITSQFEDWHRQLQATFVARGHRNKRARREARALISVLYGALVSARLHNDPQVFMDQMNRLKKSYA